MTDYTQLTARELRLKWAEIIGRSIAQIGKNHHILMYFNYIYYNKQVS